jgi:hypothetical protein
LNEGISKDEERAGVAKLLGGRICSLVGLLFGLGGVLVALLSMSDDVSAGVIGATLGILGYFLGARRFGTVTVFIGVAAIFFMAAASTGLIPGVTPMGHGYN